MKVLLTGSNGQLGKAIIDSKPKGIELIKTNRGNLDLANKEECLEMFISHNLEIEHHKRCVENKKTNKYDLDICKDCNISFLRKWHYCDHRFNDCYNENCKAYYYENYDEDIDVYNNYTGFCSRKCNNRYHM